MKKLLFIILFIIYCTRNSYSNRFTNDAESFIDFWGINNSNKEYISYEFGFSKINSVYIVKNDTHLDVYISDGNKVSFSTMCEISPILNWAFEKAPNESSSVRFITKREYEPLFYKLSIMVDDTLITIDSSTMLIIGDDAFVEKIDELKKFILNLWVNSLQSQNID